MKLATYTYDGSTRLGALVGESLLDLRAAHAAENPGGALPTTLLELVQGGGTAFDAGRGVFEQAAANPVDYAPHLHPLSDVTLHAPLPRPGKIICVGLNYADHCREQDVPFPERPLLFTKFTSAVSDPGAPISWPEGSSEQVDFEAELAVVIGREAKNVEEADALDYVAGYMTVNDVSARDVQFADQQWDRGKGFDTFYPMGPYLVTADEIPDPQALAIQTRVNGETMQDSSTAEMIFTVARIIAFITRTATLYPGDVISTGTPHGVGVFRSPQVFLKPGDVVEVEVEGLGVLRNPVA